MTPRIRPLISKKDRLLEKKMGPGVIIDEQVSKARRRAQKELQKREKLSGAIGDCACTS